MAGLLLFGGAGAFGADRDFSVQVAPLLRGHCFDCHAGKSAEAGVDLKALLQAPDFDSRFKTWEKIGTVLQQRQMPPKDAKQPTTRDRKAVASAIRRALDRHIRENAGDPGPVVMRRLTSAEYANSIRDLTGLGLSLEKRFTNDAVGGEGFTNFGGAQFMQDSALERYLEAAKSVAGHAVIGSGPLAFADDPGQTGLELSAIRRIQRIYRRYGFRAGAGEGAEPFGLTMYSKAFFVAWQFKHRVALGRRNATLTSLAKAEGISGRFAEHVWRVLHTPNAAFPVSALVTHWRALPTPQGDRASQTKVVRAGCETAFRFMRNWQRALADSTGNEEEAALLTAGKFHVQPKHRFTARLDWTKGADKAGIEIIVLSATNRVTRGAIVRWNNPQIRFRRMNRRWMRRQPLSRVLDATNRKRLKLKQNEFLTVAPSKITVDFDVPAGTIAAELIVEVELDRANGTGTPVRCTISDGVNDGETIAESGGHSVLLVDPKMPEFESWRQGVLQFAKLLPEISHREPAPSDRDPIPKPFDGTYNSTERNLFHYRIKYHRDDDFLVKYILDDATRQRLDRAWVDLLASFEYHDAWLQFVAGKYKLRLGKRTIASLNPDWIAKLPAEWRGFITRLRESYVSGRRKLRAAQPGHVRDALRFAARAWRRPVTNAEAKRLVAFYKSLRSGGLDHTKAMRALLARILVAPAFLYRIEPPVKPGKVVQLSDWEMASRLSYFLWASPPDAELRRAAAAGRLTDPAELARQAQRMLRDPKARRFATEFFGQWFGFYRFDNYRGIDARRFPEFTDSLKASMYDESVSFFEHMIRRDRPVREILFADYGFLNPQLAKHYGIPATIFAAQKKVLAGSEKRQMTLVRGLDKHRRGGLLRLGAVLTVTSAPLRTSPVKRGDWILRRVLGTPVPPPPADAGSIPADDATSDGKTVRERLVAHRSKASCANCHSRIDPLGFALEHFDAVGRWRGRYRDKQRIDTGGTLNDGTKIAGFQGLKRYLQKNRSRFEQTLCSKLLGYALGRSEIASDRPLITAMQADLKKDGRFSVLVLRIVTSRQFRYRRGAAKPTKLSDKESK